MTPRTSKSVDGGREEARSASEEQRQATPRVWLMPRATLGTELIPGAIPGAEARAFTGSTQGSGGTRAEPVEMMGATPMPGIGMALRAT